MLNIFLRKNSHYYANLVASPSTPSIATRATTANTSHPNVPSVLSRHRSSSATNPSGVTSPLSPSNVNSNHIDQSMSPPITSQSMPNTATRTNPLIATKVITETNIDPSISVSEKKKLIEIFIQIFN
jgi:hypothetical protein